MRLGDFTTLSFDCYGTLIDWERGILAALAPWLADSGIAAAEEEVLEAFAAAESALQAEAPAMLSPALLAAVHGRMARRWGVAEDAAAAAAFGASVGDWPAFADAPEALRQLQRHHRLVILSNVDRAGFRRSNDRLGVEFAAVHTAEDIGSYKPAQRNFDYLVARLAAQGIDKAQILHTAQSPFHDLVPARAAGLATAWIDRRHDKPGGGATAPASEVRPDFRFHSLAAMAAAAQAVA